jgi:hypothetical protein
MSKGLDTSQNKIVQFPGKDEEDNLLESKANIWQKEN